jgi:dihydrofolate reductase
MQASVFIATSLDGFIARENGDIEWLTAFGDPTKDARDYGYNDFMKSVDVLIMGRNSYEKVLTFGAWPYGSKPVVVLSSKGVAIPENISATVESMSCSPHELIGRLAKRGAGHLYIDGGKTIQGFLNAGLITQIIITRIPTLLGRGIPLFGLLHRDIMLKHLNTVQFESGLMQSKYEVLA